MASSHTNFAPQVQGDFDLSDLLGDASNVATLPHPGNLAVALDLARRGFAVFPCKPDKSPVTPRGFHDATLDLDQIRSWWKANPDALPALPTGARNRIAVLDLDRHRAGQDGIEALRAIGLDPVALSPIAVDTPNSGRHLYFRFPGDLGNTTGKAERSGIDVRGEGGYVIAPGAVLPDGRVYRATGRLDRASLPAWPPALLPPRRDDGDLSALLDDPLPVDWAEVRRALPFIDPDCDRDTWIRVGMALHAASEGGRDAFELWDTWSAGAIEPGKYQAGVMRGQWRSFARRAGVDIGTLFHIAAEHGWSRAPEFTADDFEDLPPLDPTAPPIDWRRLLHRSEEGSFKSTPHNVSLIVRNDDRLSGVFGRDLFAERNVIVDKPAILAPRRPGAKPTANLAGKHWRPGPLADVHMAELRTLISAPTTQQGYGFNPSRDDVEDAIETVARERAFHPIRQRLESETWDGASRLDRLYVDYLGAPDTPYHRETARLTLIGAVARVFEPGHKFDFMAIIEGAQGIRKSTFVRTLGLDWYGDPTIREWDDGKTIIEQTRGFWIVEIPELSAMTKADVNALKAGISRNEDTARLSYARQPVTVPRQWVAIGTTNDREYLRDPTGNRRFWPIACTVAAIDIDRLRSEIGQIWAEALHAYRDIRSKQRHGDLPLALFGAAEAEAQRLQVSRRLHSAEEIEAERIESWLDRPIGTPDGFDDLDTLREPALRQATCPAQIWAEMYDRLGPIPHAEATKIGKALSLSGWLMCNSTPPAELARYGKRSMRFYRRPVADSKPSIGG